MSDIQTMFEGIPSPQQCTFADGCTVLPVVEQMVGYQDRLEELEAKKDPTLVELSEMLGLSAAIRHSVQKMLDTRACDNCLYRLV